jgi:dihydrofolate reductase
MLRSFNLIVAFDNKRGIGKNGDIPWNIPEDLKYFSNVTKNSIVIMGRKTWDSIPIKHKPLKNRYNIIISSSLKHSNHYCVCPNFESALEEAFTFPKLQKIFVISGSSVYQKALEKKKIKKMIL